MPEAAGRIGSNALLQLAPVLEDYGGRGLLDRVFAAARLALCRIRRVPRRPLMFEIAGNSIVRGEQAAHPVCHWHAAAFQRLFQVLVDPRLNCTETACAAAGDHVCRFQLDNDLALSRQV